MKSSKQALRASMVLVVIAGLVFLLVALFGGRQRSQAAARADDGKLRIIVFGAHPDDAELILSPRSFCSRCRSSE